MIYRLLTRRYAGISVLEILGVWRGLTSIPLRVELPGRVAGSNRLFPQHPANLVACPGIKYGEKEVWLKGKSKAVDRSLIGLRLQKGGDNEI